MGQNPKEGSHDFKMYGSVVVGSKGQIVIPKDVREELGIETGDSLIVVVKHGKAIGMIKSDDLDEFMQFMQREMELCRQNVTQP